MSVEQQSNRQRALELANGFEGTDTEIVQRAEKYLAFLEAGGDTAETAAPKAPRGRKSAKTNAPAQPDAPAQQSTAAAASPSDPPAATAATATVFAPVVANDIFGAPSAPAVTPTPPTASAETPSKPSSDKQPTIEEVRAALTDVQTGFESRPKAMELLKKYAPNTVTTGELKKEDYAKLIKDCRDELAKIRK